jgi:hypothetical protein
VADYLPKKNDKAVVLCTAKQFEGADLANSYSIRHAIWNVKALFADKLEKSNTSFVARLADSHNNNVNREIGNSLSHFTR